MKEDMKTQRFTFDKIEPANGLPVLYSVFDNERYIGSFNCSSTAVKEIVDTMNKQEQRAKQLYDSIGRAHHFIGQLTANDLPAGKHSAAKVLYAEFKAQLEAGY